MPVFLHTLSTRDDPFLEPASFGNGTCRFLSWCVGAERTQFCPRFVATRGALRWRVLCSDSPRCQHAMTDMAQPRGRPRDKADGGRPMKLCQEGPEWAPPSWSYEARGSSSAWEDGRPYRLDRVRGSNKHLVKPPPKKIHRCNGQRPSLLAHLQ